MRRGGGGRGEGIAHDNKEDSHCLPWGVETPDFGFTSTCIYPKRYCFGLCVKKFLHFCK